MPRGVNDYSRLLLISGAAIALVVAIPVVVRQVAEPNNGATNMDVLRWLAVLVIAQVAGSLLHWRAGAALVQMVGALLLVALPPCFGFEGVLLVMVALRLGFEQRGSVAFSWVVAQSAAFFFILGNHWTFRASVLIVGAYLPFQLLAVLVSRAVAAEVELRRELVRINAELLATRELLAERSRVEERTRISRDLHDILGHHLVALSLQLELAAATTPAESAKHIGKAQALAASLLEDVRSTVHAIRTETNVVESLRILAADTPRPVVHVEAAPDLAIRTPAAAETIVLCARELVTNAAKHSGAEHLWLTLRRAETRVELFAVDDGRGADVVAMRGGIAGMQERLRLLGGGLLVQTELGRGFAVTAWLPCPD